MKYFHETVTPTPHPFVKNFKNSGIFLTMASLRKCYGGLMEEWEVLRVMHKLSDHLSKADLHPCTMR